jgi:membrane protein implicated in regulation of membrane protease activity
MRRRSWLALGALSAVALVVGGGSMALWQPGLRDSKLSAAGQEVFGNVARGLLDGSLPADPAAQVSALQALLVRIDSLVAGLPPHAQAELSQLLSLLASAGGRRVLTGLARPWPEASVGDIQQALQGMRLSAVSLKQQAYQALHDIVAGAYFADASTWPLLAYPGPREI